MTGGSSQVKVTALQKHRPVMAIFGGPSVASAISIRSDDRGQLQAFGGQAARTPPSPQPPAPLPLSSSHLDPCAGPRSHRHPHQKARPPQNSHAAPLSGMLIEKAAANLEVLLKPGRQRNILIAGQLFA